MMEKEIKAGIYRHYKNKDYRVLYVAFNSETKEEMVVYQARDDEGRIWVRPKKMFLEEVDVDGKKKARFEFIGEEENDQQKKYLRALADYQNLLKQTAKEKMEFAIYANERMLREILPVYSHLKMALEHDEKTGGNSNEIINGVKHVVKQFKDTLEKLGVTEIEVKNEFDHNAMEAVGSKETEDKKLDGQVAKIVKAGYKLNGKVIEAAKVIVYKIK